MNKLPNWRDERYTVQEYIRRNYGPPEFGETYARTAQILQERNTEPILKPKPERGIVAFLHDPIFPELAKYGFYVAVFLRLSAEFQGFFQHLAAPPF